MVNKIIDCASLITMQINYIHVMRRTARDEEWKQNCDWKIKSFNGQHSVKVGGWSEVASDHKQTEMMQTTCSLGSG